MNPSGIDAAISGYVLAGGASSRLGRDKVLLPWLGGTLLAHAVTRLRHVCETVSVCGNRSDLRRHLPPSVEVIQDAIPGCGPLGGIVAALERSHTDWNLLLAVDLPLIPAAFLRRLIASVANSRSPASQALCILPRVDDLPQPLCGLYRRALASGLRRALEKEEYKIMRALNDAAKQIVPQEPSSISEGDEAHPVRDTAPIAFLDTNVFSQVSGSSRIDPKEWFLNINTEADLLCARDLITTWGHE